MDRFDRQIDRRKKMIDGYRYINTNRRKKEQMSIRQTNALIARYTARLPE
jgi:hypothetical protein